MKQLFAFLYLTLLLSLTSSCQETKENSKFNFSFEKVTVKQPLGWENFGSSNYVCTIDSLIKKSGKYAGVIEYNGTSPDFKAFAYTIPANYEGKTIRLTGFIKTENVSDGWAGLWMRIDPSVAFDNMQNRGLKGTNDWQKLEITLQLNPAKTKQIVLGAILKGKGKIWVDDLTVSIDGKDIAALDPIPKKVFLADIDKEFEYGSKISQINLTDTKKEDLAILGKVWGFLKYHHPLIATGNKNWDFELFRILPQILDAKNAIERNNILSLWVDGLGKIEPKKDKTKELGTTKINPDLSWIDSSILDSRLAMQLMLVKNAERKSDSYYIGLNQGVGNPEFKNELPYKTMAYPDPGFRLLSLFRYWNIIQYYFPYKNLINENWNDVLKEFIPQFLDATNELDYKKAVLALIARVHDTHANIWGDDNALKIYKGINYAPVEISFIEDKAVVTGYHDQKLGTTSGLKIGDVIEKVNGKPVAEIIKEKLPFTPASNYSTQLRGIAVDLLRTNDSLLKISYKRGESSFTMQVKCFSSSIINTYSRYSRSDTCFKMLDPNIAYIYPGSIKNEYLPKFMADVLKSKGLIIDLRCYPSEFVVFTLGKYLMPRQTSFVKFSSGSITEPGLFLIKETLKVGEINNAFYKGKVVIIVNELTQSQAEYTTMAFKVAPKATVIGSTTAGADGNVSQFYLPGGISTMISGIGVYYPDGRETQRIGIVPDIKIHPTIQGIKDGRDELLEKAIEIINK